MLECDRFNETEDGIAIGEKKGLQKCIESVATALIQANLLTDEQIATVTELPLKTITALRQKV